MRTDLTDLFFAAVYGCFAQSGVIPSDASHVSAADRAALLEAVCPGHVTERGCSTCPGASFSTEPWELESITLGHFLAAASEDAFASGVGCEPHVNLFGGSYLLTKDRSHWRKVWYIPGARADDCKKLTGSDRRDRLVCDASDMHQGFASEFLYLLDPGQKPGEQGIDPHGVFFNVPDSVGECQVDTHGMLVSGKIESVAFVPASPAPSVRIVATARLGKATIPPEILESLESCGRARLATVSRKYEFLFDGNRVVPSQANPPMAGFEALAPETSYSVAK